MKGTWKALDLRAWHGPACTAMAYERASDRLVVAGGSPRNGEGDVYLLGSDVWVGSGVCSPALNLHRTHPNAEHASVLTVWRCVPPPADADPKARAKTAPLVLDHQLAIPVGPPLLLKPHEAYARRWWPFSLVAAMDGSVPVQVSFDHWLTLLTVSLSSSVGE